MTYVEDVDYDTVSPIWDSIFVSSDVVVSSGGNI